MKVYTPFTWQHLQESNLRPEEVLRIESRLDAILLSWKDTKYQAGQQCKGVATDCVGFVCGVLDELTHREPTPRESLPQDAAFHARETAEAGMRLIARMYSPMEFRHESQMWVVEPGDIVVTGSEGGGPGHAMIVGARPNELWHANNRRVMRGGMVLMDKFQKVFRVCRMGNRASW